MPRVSKLPQRLQPMLAVLTDAPFDDPDWVFESKWDGFRMVSSIAGGKVALFSASTFRMRRRSPRGWQRASLTLEPHSVYLLQGPARTHWEHSIPAVDRLRYSITFRNIIEPPAVR